MSSFANNIIAGAIGAAAGTAVLLLIPAGTTTVATVAAATVLAGGMVASARIIANSLERNPGHRRNRREMPQTSNQPVGHHGGRRIDPP